MTNYASPIIIPHDTSVPGKFKIKIGVANQTNGSYGYEVELPSVQIDTGSCGIVIPAVTLYQQTNSATSTATEDSTTGETAYTASQLALMPLRPGVTTKYEPAIIKYQPSGDSIIGFYFYIDELGIGDDGQGKPLVIAKNVKVMGATSGAPFMMGVGFDRPLIADNAFLANLITANNATPLYPSYYLDHQTVQLGLNPSNSFVFQALTVQTQGSSGTYQDWNWNTPQAAITVANADTTLLKSTPVSLLIDTGLDLMMVNNMGTLFPLPGTDSSWDTANITLEINADSSASAASCFGFSLAGTASAQFSKNVAPAAVYKTENSVVMNGDVVLLDSPRVTKPAPTLVYVISGQDVGKPFINTGFNPLFAYGMMFDPTNNQVGFKSLSQTS
ncbi:MAG TPA: hypothetical protein VIF37_00840 [Methylobacter sp.]|jgi:hypothetical protein